MDHLTLSSLLTDNHNFRKRKKDLRFHLPFPSKSLFLIDHDKLHYQGLKTDDTDGITTNVAS